MKCDGGGEEWVDGDGERSGCMTWEEWVDGEVGWG